MDSLNPNPHFNPARINSIYQSQQSAKQTKPSSHMKAEELQPRAIAKVEKVETFSTMFDDNELERLQTNLESIASLAERALKRFKTGRN